jgi:membrane protein
VTEQPSSPSWLARLRARHAWLDHLVRAGERYTDTHGNHYAAAITYFSVLALVPLLMVAFASVALVLASNPALLARLKAEIGKALPAGLAQTLSPVIDQAITSATTVGVIGLLFALVTGLGWMTNFRDALSVQWGQGRHTPTSYLRRLGSDLASLIGLDLAIVVSFGLTAFVGGGFARQLLGYLGLGGAGWAAWLLERRLPHPPQSLLRRLPLRPQQNHPGREWLAYRTSLRGRWCRASILCPGARMRDRGPRP